MQASSYVYACTCERVSKFKLINLIWNQKVEQGTSLKEILVVSSGVNFMPTTSLYILTLKFHWNHKKDLMNRAFTDAPYIRIDTDRIWKPYIGTLIRAGIAQRHPNDANLIKLVEFHK